MLKNHQIPLIPCYFCDYSALFRKNHRRKILSVILFVKHLHHLVLLLQDPANLKSAISMHRLQRIIMYTSVSLNIRFKLKAHFKWANFVLMGLSKKQKMMYNKLSLNKRGCYVFSVTLFCSNFKCTLSID